MSKRFIVKGTSPNEDKPIAIFMANKKHFQCYSIEEGYFEMSFDEKHECRKRPRSAKYMLIKRDDKDPALKHLSLKNQCIMLTERGEKLKKLTDDKINIFRTGSTAKTAYQLFYDLCCPEEPDKITQFEIDIIEKSSHGALICGKKSRGFYYSYDICSQYPALMNSAKHRFPMSEGELKTLTVEEFNKLDFFQFGIYHVKVQDNTNSMIFRNNPDNWYTHTDLNFARKQKYTIELVDDDEPNFLFYSKETLKSGKELFGKYINYLFELKYQGHKEIKPYINALWGALTQTNKKVLVNNVYENKTVTSIMPDGDDINFESVKMTVTDRQNYFETNFARIKPFMLAYARQQTANIVLKNIDSIVRVHTDGIILNKPIEKTQPLGNKLGDLKYEGFSYCEILNSNNYIWYNDRLEMAKKQSQKFKVKFI